MAFLSDTALVALGFKSLGVNVKISERASIHNAELMDIGDHVRIDDFSVVSGKVKFGRNVHIAVFCNVAGGELGVSFEDFSGLAYGCHVFTQSDDYSGRTLTNPTVPDAYKSETKAPVLIGRHCIVGTCSVIFPGVVLGMGSAVGAMSMVTKSTEPWFLYFGIPARKLKARSRQLLTAEQDYLRDESQLRREH